VYRRSDGTRAALNGQRIEKYKVLVGNHEGKRPLGRPRRRWEDGIRMDLRETGLGVCGLDSTGVVQGPVAGCCECGDEPSGSCAAEWVSSWNADVTHSTWTTVLQWKVNTAVSRVSVTVVDVVKYFCNSKTVWMWLNTFVTAKRLQTLVLGLPK
jgi:hypothetical protein